MRTFIAINLPENINSLAYKIGTALKELAEIKLVPANNMHITLCFLGEIEERELHLVKDVLDKLKYDKVPLKLVGFNLFKRKGIPSIFFIEGESKRLNSLVDDLKVNLRKKAITFDDKKFIPHLTIARIKKVKRAKEFYTFLEKINENFVEKEVIIDKITVYKSTLTPAGAIYEKLHTKKLI